MGRALEGRRGGVGGKRKAWRGEGLGRGRGGGKREGGWEEGGGEGWEGKGEGSGSAPVSVSSKQTAGQAEQNKLCSL